MSDAETDRSSHYTWAPGDVVVDPVAVIPPEVTPDDRMRVREAMGDAAYNLSDAQIDAVILASRSGVR